MAGDKPFGESFKMYYVCAKCGCRMQYGVHEPYRINLGLYAGRLLDIECAIIAQEEYEAASK
jgi:hypothetical protein